MLKNFQAAMDKGLTLFAPNDEAFKAEGVPDLSSLSSADLVTLLQYHALLSYNPKDSLKSVDQPISTMASGASELFGKAPAPAPGPSGLSPSPAPSTAVPAPSPKAAEAPSPFPLSPPAPPTSAPAGSPHAAADKVEDKPSVGAAKARPLASLMAVAGTALWALM
ncbi:hypothetical protein HPP92_021940 [Vanilla planifolia]|uniref:FAS1 domain-containing protein n=1 Tax=Vanilla planifolia TaxID=51239 RepID=A0A835UEN3_VANPL|nr:hypothetical protein HPP92_021940 [Vanilla planifolia]